MADSCFRVAENINECNNGTILNFEYENNAILFNKEDIATVIRDVSNPTIVTSLALKPGKVGYVVRFREAHPLKALDEKTEEKAYGETYKVEGEFVIYGKTAEAANLKRKLDNSRVVMLIRQAAHAGTSSYRIILGLESGLKPMAGDNFSDEKGGFVFKFGEANMAYPANFLWNADEATTAAIEANLLV